MASKCMQTTLKGLKLYMFKTGAHLRATERHLPYEITQCYLPADTGERASPQPQPGKPVLNLPTPEGSKAELTLVLVIY